MNLLVRGNSFETLSFRQGLRLDDVFTEINRFDYSELKYILLYDENGIIFGDCFYGKGF